MGGMDDVAERSIEEADRDGDRVMGGKAGDGGPLCWPSGWVSETCLAIVNQLSVAQDQSRRAVAHLRAAGTASTARAICEECSNEWGYAFR